MKRNIWRGMTSLTGTLLAAALGVTWIAQDLKVHINTALNTSSQIMRTTDEEGSTLYYESDYSTLDEWKEARNNLFEQIQEEGSVLLKNNGALPLEKQSNITLLGYGGYDSVYTSAGGGGSFGVSEATITLPEACRRNFNVNETVETFYNQYGEVPRTTKAGWSAIVDKLAEIDPAKFTGEVENSFQEYSDAAIVTISRTAGEGKDLDYTPVPVENGGDGAHDMLQLSDTERAVIETAKNNFDKVIVLLNSDNAMAVGELEHDPDIDAVLWIGSPGIYGMYGVSDILCGEANPSGGLVDTYAVDPKSAPAMRNFGDYTFVNATKEMTENKGDKYVIYAEGIYVGYKYYETRYEDSVMGQGNADDPAGATQNTETWNYSEEVVYPFGYGLSYTEFKQTLDSIDVDIDQHKAKAVVTVENTGDTAGSSKVEVFAQAPYTDYDRSSRIEKAAVQLMGYTKTDVLEPGESQTVEIEMDLKYLASYDYVNAKTYIMDDGDYYFAVGNGAHEALNNILALKGYTVDNGMDANGTAGCAAKFTNDAFTVYDTSFNAKKITNLFDFMDINSGNNLNEEVVTYLSRSDWKNTYPVSYTDIAASETMIPLLSGDTYKPDTNMENDFETGSAKTNYKLIDLYSVKDEPDSEMWDDWLDQWTLEDLCTIPASVSFIEHIGMFETNYADAGHGINGMLNTTNETKLYYTDPSVVKNDPYYSTKLNTYSSAVVMASMFSPEMVEKVGHMFANDGLWSNYCGLNIGIDIHRTAYAGRNNESFAEDSVLCALHGVTLVKAMQERGLVAAPKHIAFNNQETNRQGVATFSNEQAGREIYLRCFEGPFCEGGALWSMSSFPRLGCKAAPWCSELLIDLMREEWGFEGFVETDMAQDSYMYAAACMVNGSGKFATFDSEYWIHALKEAAEGNPELVAALRETAKRRAYTALHSNAVNGYSTNTAVVNVLAWWEKAIYGVDAVLAILAIGSLAAYVVSRKKNKKVGGN